LLAVLNKRDVWVLVGILLLAFAARAASLRLLSVLEPVQGDARQYYGQSVRMLNGESYDWNRAPGYSAVLTLVQSVFGGHPSVVVCQWTNVAFSLLGVLGVYWAGLFLYSHSLGQWAALVVALDPRYVTHPFYLMVDNVHTPMIIWSLVLLIWCIKHTDAKRGILTGVVMGLTTLVRTIGLYFIPIAAICILVQGTNRRRGNAKVAGVMVLSTILTIVPWTIRNYARYDRFVLVSFDDGNPLLMGNVSGKEERQDVTLQVKKELRTHTPHGISKDAFQVYLNGALRKKAVELILDRQPTWFLEKVAEVGPRILTSGGWLLKHGGDDPANFGKWGVRLIFGVFVISESVIFLLLCVGLARHTTTKVDWVLILFTCYILLVHVATHFGPIRFQLPFLWILILYAVRAFIDKPPWTIRRVSVLVFLLATVIAGQTASAIQAHQKAVVVEQRNAERISSISNRNQGQKRNAQKRETSEQSSLSNANESHSKNKGEAKPRHKGAHKKPSKQQKAKRALQSSAAHKSVAPTRLKPQPQHGDMGDTGQLHKHQRAKTRGKDDSS